MIVVPHPIQDRNTSPATHCDTSSSTRWWLAIHTLNDLYLALCPNCDKMSTNTCSHITAHARCSYTTVKCVKIRNWKLGAIHYFFQFSIFCYGMWGGGSYAASLRRSRGLCHCAVVVYAVIFERGFMFKEQIVGGSLTLNSQAPPRTSGLTNVSYCCNTTIGDCVNNSKVILPCAFWDEYQAEYPQSQGEMIAITTRVTVSQQSTPDNEDCTYQNWGPNCVWEDVGDPVAQFIDGAEDFTIRVGMRPTREALAVVPPADFFLWNLHRYGTVFEGSRSTSRVSTQVPTR